MATDNQSIYSFQFDGTKHKYTEDGLGANLSTLGEEEEDIDEDLESSPVKNDASKNADNASLPPNPVTPKPATVIFTAIFLTQSYIHLIILNNLRFDEMSI